MKTILKILLLTVTTALYSQPVLSTTSLQNINDVFKHADNGNYAKDIANERNQYLGLWRYNQDGILFEIKIELKNKRINKIENDGNLFLYYYMDVVVIKYKLMKNGIQIYNNLQTLTPPVRDSYGFKTADSNFLAGRFLDYTRNVYANYTITKLNTTPEKIIFEINELHYTLLNPPSFYINSGIKLFTIPTEAIEMVKVD